MNIKLKCHCIVFEHPMYVKSLLNYNLYYNESFWVSGILQEYPPHPTSLYSLRPLPTKFSKYLFGFLNGTKRNQARSLRWLRVNKENDAVDRRPTIGDCKLHLCLKSDWKWTCKDQSFHCWQSQVLYACMPAQASSRMFNPI